MKRFTFKEEWLDAIKNCNEGYQDCIIAAIVRINLGQKLTHYEESMLSEMTRGVITMMVNEAKDAADMYEYLKAHDLINDEEEGE